MLKKIIILLVSILVIFEFWHTYIAFNVYFPITPKDVSRVFAVFEPNDIVAYKSLIPKEFEMPKTPKVKIDFVEVTPTWHEFYLSIMISHNGEQAWHGVTWPIDAYAPFWLGYWVGYPKFQADSFRYTKGIDTSNVEVIKDNKLYMAMEFKEVPGDKNEFDDNVRRNTEPYFLLMPPLKGPQINKLKFDLFMPTEQAERFGNITIRFSESEPWSKVIGENGTRTVKGTYLIKSGREFGMLIAKRIN